MTVGIRPEHMEPVARDAAALELAVDLVEALGADSLVHGQLAGSSQGTAVTVRVDGARRIKAGKTLALAVAPERVHFFDRGRPPSCLSRPDVPCGFCGISRTSPSSLESAPCLLMRLRFRAIAAPADCCPRTRFRLSERAIELGVDALELDLGLTRTGYPWCTMTAPSIRSHPERGREWLAPPGPYLDTLTHAELSEFDVGRVRPGSKVAQRFPNRSLADGTRIPTLAQVLSPGGDPVRTRSLQHRDQGTPLAPEESAGPEEFARAVSACCAPRG